MPRARHFSDWVFDDVLPSIRKFGFYKLQQEHAEKIDFFLDKINFLEKENLKIRNDQKCDAFPDGGIVYVIDYSNRFDEIYRIGMTGEMKNRKKVYDTHMLHKRNVIFYVETPCPSLLERCVTTLLDDYRYYPKKDFFKCKLETIKKIIRNCEDGYKCAKQQGGTKIPRSKKPKRSGSKTSNKIPSKATYRARLFRILTDEIQKAKKEKTIHVRKFNILKKRMENPLII